VEPNPLDQADVLVRLARDIPGAPDVVIRRPGATVGRNPAAEVCIEDPAVSWEHAQIVSREGAPAIVDLASSNGTYVNGERIDQSLLLHHDRLQFGAVVFRVVRA
jgi:pSer/pThr/pTyr-binding forkhead associated (FHA) protein